jgi:hypothetical protein
LNFHASNVGSAMRHVKPFGEQVSSTGT